MYNTLGTENFHIKTEKEADYIDLKIGDNPLATFEPSQLPDLIKFLQEAQRLFGLAPKQPDPQFTIKTLVDRQLMPPYAMWNGVPNHE